MSSYYEEEAVGTEDHVPFDVTEEVEVEDLSEQQGGVVDKATRVSFEIRKSTTRVTEDKDTKKWMVKKLALDVVIGTDGIDGEGKYAGAHLFPEFILTMNTKDFPDKYSSDWWKTKSRYPTKMFFKAMRLGQEGVKVNDEFHTALVSRGFIADIKVKPRQEKVNGKYINIDGEFENELTNFRPAATE
jgi:hypothetical protein